MKKIIICIAIILVANTVKAQANITDTTQYLRDSIEVRKAYFSSTNFSYFLSKLQLGIKYYSVDVPLPNRPDTMKVDRISLYFNTINDMVQRELQHKKNPGIEIIFVSTITIPKAYLEKGGLLDWGTDWNAAKANFFANYVISNVNGL
jgi:hypothetical protein